MAVRWATRADQETLAGTLATLPGADRAQRMKPPATIIVGEVVRLREKLNWFETPAALWQAHRGDARQGQADALSLEAGGAGRGVDRIADHRNRGRRRLRRRWTRAIARSRCVRLADLHQRQWRAFFLWIAWTVPKPTLRGLRAKICAIGPATRAAMNRCI